MKKFGNNGNWIIRYHPTVLSKDMPALDFTSALRVQKAIEFKLSTNPIFYGATLHGIPLRLFKLRVGDWRIVYEISPPFVDILLIAHRRDVYARLRRRYNL